MEKLITNHNTNLISTTKLVIKRDFPFLHYYDLARDLIAVLSGLITKLFLFLLIKDIIFFPLEYNLNDSDFLC